MDLYLQFRTHVVVPQSHHLEMGHNVEMAHHLVNREMYDVPTYKTKWIVFVYLFMSYFVGFRGEFSIGSRLTQWLGSFHRLMARLLRAGLLEAQDLAFKRKITKATHLEHKEPWTQDLEH
ncbi:hypothetical protein VNO77_34247 [Canavalia gladiata]|uniref:Uncharacterized protein n=1 Tax=Canavalia gladiata TaxID=3824 RepID=A0AAN9PX30_CANGL